MGVDIDRLDDDYRQFCEMAVKQTRRTPGFSEWLTMQPLGYQQAFGVWTWEDAYAAHRLHNERVVRLRGESFRLRHMPGDDA
jgi:hypothetical protein